MTQINETFYVDDVHLEYANPKYHLAELYRPLARIEKLVVHCTATDSSKWDDPAVLINYDLGPNHISRKGCPTATYHFYVNKPGDIFQLVSMNFTTWHVAGHNRDSVAVCINHGAVKDNVSDIQFNALIEAICYVFDKLDWSYDEESVRDRVFFHREFNPGKTCPGILDKEKVVKAVIEKLKGYGDNN